nr:xyloglucan endotransglucosylase/hydrolase protein 9-like [Ipomoea batatas]
MAVTAGRLTWPCGFPLKPIASTGYKIPLTVAEYFAEKKLHLAPSPPSLSLSIMAFSRVVIFGVFCVGVLMVGLSSAATARFDDLFQPTSATDHLLVEGDVLRMKLDSYSGAGFQSKSKYMFGKVTAQIKLVEGDSAGTVTAFYMSSDGPKHHEFDFEFLGNTSGEPYLVQTNVYVNGVGNREERVNLWFDPTKDFHRYSIVWTSRKVLFVVDDTPIRVHSNLEAKGIPFPRDQAMGVYSSIWNADDWATQGGRVKTDWSHAPFVASYTGFEIDACECAAANTNAAANYTSQCSSSNEKRFWWDEPTVSELSVHQSHQLIWVRANHMVYNYCADTARFPVAPVECQHHRA